ncbi:beta-lactamase family protein [Herbiconiux sp. CPCC 203407]|uniref:Beta-lactamase family protein n=1 Tax=Herbiconiux oxytropis TaxID=2970915 RepID=A0AA41XIH1_9MICO|nr:serine hydrolase domain-containing protein [Herbiconiux oxytropis]MCS5723463.1 beta-lactamase family protein [Herbiconiux oxytropis]MCS5726550.1 beta-lactamase family protein [Herbiconiux oxytropis]
MTLTRTTASLVTLMVGSLLLAGCSAGGGSSSPAPATSSPATADTGATPAAASDCVTDPDAVMARTAELPTSPMPEAATTAIDEAARQGFADAAAPGAIVAVQSPDGLFLQAYGTADPATGAPMTTDMHHRVGSISKTFTGTLLLQLVDEGEAGLDDPVSDYLEGVPNGDEVTLRMLADMSSGLASYTKDEAWQASFFGDPLKVWEPDELISTGLALPPVFAPGESFDYSNTNTLLIGKVIEKITGKTFDEVIDERIIEPLGLMNTNWPGASADFPQPHAQGFTLQGETATPDAPANATDWNPSWGWTAGELITTAADLATYARHQATGSGLVSPELQRERLTGFDDYSGYGLAITCAGGWIGHTGELPGFNTVMLYDTANDITLITMTNSDIASGDCPEGATITDNPTADLPCSSPALRVATAITTALGNPYVGPGQKR